MRANDIGALLTPQPGYKNSDFVTAIKGVFSLTDGGGDLMDKPIIKDAEGQVVFSCEVADDVQILLEMDRVGLDKVEIVEPAR